MQTASVSPLAMKPLLLLPPRPSSSPCSNSVESFTVLLSLNVVHSGGIKSRRSVKLSRRRRIYDCGWRRFVETSPRKFSREERHWHFLRSWTVVPGFYHMFLLVSHWNSNWQRKINHQRSFTANHSLTSQTERRWKPRAQAVITSQIHSEVRGEQTPSTDSLLHFSQW